MWYPTETSAEVKLKFMETTAMLRDLAERDGDDAERARLQAHLEELNSLSDDQFSPPGKEVDEMESRGIFSNEDDHYQFTI